MFDYAETMKQCRTFRGYSQTELARRVGVNRSQICCYEAKANAPSIDRYIDIMNALGFELTVTVMEGK